MRAIANHNKSESLITFKKGHEIYYWGLDDIEKLKSLELG
jgi:phage terminase large subunit